MTRNDHQSRPRRGFSLTELLVVISIVVVLALLALPAFNLISGKASVEGASNQLAALLGRARAEAIGLQTPTGVMFYRDPGTQKDMAVLVQRSSVGGKTGDSPAVEVWLDLTTTPDGIGIPAGITAHVITDGGSAPNDRYTGYNIPTNYLTNGGIPVGGVILFDGVGRLSQSVYAFRCSTGTGPSGPQTPIGNLLERTTGTDLYFAPAPGTSPFSSGIGFAMVDRDAFANGLSTNSAGDARTTTPVSHPGRPASSGDEQAEEDWLDKNATPTLVNRYNGTLIKGQQ